jgi:ABC-type sugar transport system ATPase subunit
VSSSRPLLRVVQLSTAWGTIPVLRSVTLTVAEGEYFVLLGPNGSGKTTLLRCIAGLERPLQGRVALGDADLSNIPPHRRGIGLMFQDPALFSHRSVYENIAYAPLLQRAPRPVVDEVVGRMVELLHLQGFEDRRPGGLSGGERQRVALARTLAARPRLVLLDEPFASIDAEVKADLRTEFRRALSALGTAAIHVTHDREEGLFLGDRVGLLFEGSLETVGIPSEVFGSPGTERTARFLGYNVLPGPSGIEAVHPSDVRIDPAGAGGIAVTVVASGTVGRENLVVLRADDGDRIEVRSPGPSVDLVPGTRVTVRWDRSTRLSSRRPAQPRKPVRNDAVPGRTERSECGSPRATSMSRGTRNGETSPPPGGGPPSGKE